MYYSELRQPSVWALKAPESKNGMFMHSWANRWLYISNSYMIVEHNGCLSLSVLCCFAKKHLDPTLTFQFEWTNVHLFLWHLTCVNGLISCWNVRLISSSRHVKPEGPHSSRSFQKEAFFGPRWAFEGCFYRVLSSFGGLIHSLQARDRAHTQMSVNRALQPERLMCPARSETHTEIGLDVSAVTRAFLQRGSKQHILLDARTEKASPGQIKCKYPFCFYSDSNCSFTLLWSTPQTSAWTLCCDRTFNFPHVWNHVLW